MALKDITLGQFFPGNSPLHRMDPRTKLIGVVLYIEVEMVPMPMEGLSLAIAGKTGVAFHNMKIIIDCVVVVAGVALSFLCLHKLVYIREGTIITAVVTGKVMALVKKPLSPLVQKVCFGGVPAEAEL